MTKRPSRPLIPSPLDKLGVPADPQLLLTFYMDCLEEEFRSDPRSAIHAIQAVNYVACHWWSKDTPAPRSVEVPYWAVEVIAEAFMRYSKAREQGLITSFGEAFGIEQSGQGRRPITEELEQTKWQIDVAIAIALATDDGGSVDNAIADFVEKYGSSRRTAWRAWSRFGTRARQAISNWRTATTSGSGGSDV